MQQLSHQTLNSALGGLATFVVDAFIGFPRFVGFFRLLLEAGNGRSAVVCLMSALLEPARQYKLSSRHRCTFARAFGTIEGEQDRRFALFAADAEVPLQIGLRPLRNLHKIPCSSEMRRLSHDESVDDSSWKYSTATRKTVQEGI
jgi:hypothetical protein